MRFVGIGMVQSQESDDKSETEQCEWCGEPAYERVATGPYGEAYCSETCTENIGREVEDV